MHGSFCTAVKRQDYQYPIAGTSTVTLVCFQKACQWFWMAFEGFVECRISASLTYTCNLSTGGKSAGSHCDSDTLDNSAIGHAFSTVMVACISLD